MDERRKYVRIPDSSQLSYEVIPTKKNGKCAVKDISQGGMRFLVAQFIPKGANLKIKLALNRMSFTFEALVRVMWISEVSYGDGYEVGTQFVDIPQKAAKVLMEYIKVSFKTEERKV
jgi:c-di-GMP-binding flagellar brake protein YcgR